jgi:hypothetical protein
MSMSFLFAMIARRKDLPSWGVPIRSRIPHPIGRKRIPTVRLREEWYFTEDVLDITTAPPYRLSSQQEEARRTIARATLFHAVCGLLSTIPSQGEKSALEQLAEGFRSGPMVKNMNPGDIQCSRPHLTSSYRMPDYCTQTMCKGEPGCHGSTSVNN